MYIYIYIRVHIVVVACKLTRCNEMEGRIEPICRKLTKLYTYIHTYIHSGNYFVDYVYVLYMTTHIHTIFECTITIEKERKEEENVLRHNYTRIQMIFIIVYCILSLYIYIYIYHVYVCI